MKKRWYHVTAVLAAAAIFSGMNGFGRETCLAKETVPAGAEGVGVQAAAEPLMYGIGSTSKVVTAAAVMRLADEGKLDLKKPLITYIPEFEMADERYRRITPEMLLDHSSGLPGSTLNNAMLLGDSDTENHDMLLARLKKQRLKSDPGDIQVYCNDGFTLAEILVERVTGLSFTEYIDREFSETLGLTQFKTPQSGNLSGRLAKIYDVGTGEELPPEHTNVIGSGGIYATAMDLCRFSEIFMKNRADNAGLLSEEALLAMETSRYNEEINPNGYDTTLSYGLGWDSVETYPFSRYGIKALVKGGDTNFYHGSLTVLPEENISCAVLTSGGSSTLNQLAVQEILMTYLDEVQRIERGDEERVSRGEEAGLNLAERSGWYAGSDLLKLSVSGEGEMTVVSEGSGRRREQAYRLGEDGGFYSMDGSYISASGELSKGSSGRIGRTRLSFQEGKKGREYLMAESMEVYPGLGRVATYLPVGTRYTGNAPAKAAVSAWKALDGQEYYLLSEKYTSSAWLKRFMVKPLLLDEPGGILSFENLELRMAEVTDEAHARFFTEVPGQAGRDLNDYTRTEENGKQYLESGSYRYIAAADAEAFPDADCERTIGADGEALWFTTGDRNQKRPVVIEKPENGAWYVYDHTGRDMKCVSSSWTLSEDRPFYLPEDGRVVLVGEAGAVFTIRYAD
ncbi:serine hydrolase domain-containing protein [Hungatella sp.]|uniref:serine hydrolase domain-containing protein n=1 Tax=Hungatella sp. TaxID=2613924 RepID=UPI002A807FB1|nr:serine hydrolase domain-containing protein [Hungatella sp.]